MYRVDKETVQFEAAEKESQVKAAVNTAWLIANLGCVPNQGYAQISEGFWGRDALVFELEQRIAHKQKEVTVRLKRAIADIEREKALRQQARSNRKKTRIPVAIKTVPRGLNTGVLFGDRVIYDLNVIRIDKHEVVFKKSGQSWRQRVGATPAAYRKEASKHMTPASQQDD